MGTFLFILTSFCCFNSIYSVEVNIYDYIGGHIKYQDTVNNSRDLKIKEKVNELPGWVKIKEGSPQLYDMKSTARYVTIQIVRIIEKEKENHYRDLLKSKLEHDALTTIYPAELSKGLLHRSPPEKKTVKMVMVQWDQNTKATKSKTVEIIGRLATIKSEICEEVAEEKRDDKAKSKGKTKSSKK